MPTYIRVKDLPNEATAQAADDFIMFSGATSGSRKISRANFLSSVADFYKNNTLTYQIATLDSTGKVNANQLPASAFNYQGLWNADTNNPSLANGTGSAGSVYYVSTAGSTNFGAGAISFIVGDGVIYDGDTWTKIPAVSILKAPELEITSATGTASTLALTVKDSDSTNFYVKEDGTVKSGVHFLAETSSNNTQYASNYIRATGGAFYVDNYTTGGDTIFRASVASAIDTQVMIIDGATGNVAIGGTGAARKLHVTSSGTIAQFESTSTAAYVSLKESGGKHTYLGNALGDFVVQTADGGYSSKLVVYNGGNVAVPQGNLKTGTGTFPVAALAGVQIANGASSYSYFSATDDTKQFAAGIDHTLSEGVVGMISDHGLRVVTNNTERLRIMSDGKFAYGHSSPNAEFSIKGDTEFLDGDTGTRIGLLYDNGTEGIFELRDNNVTKVQLRSDGDSYLTGGRLGVGTASLGNYNANGDDLVIGSGSGNQGVSIASGSSSFGVLYFAKGTAPTGADAYNGYINFDHSTDAMNFGTGGTKRWTINSSGTLLAAASETPIEWNGNGIVSASSHLYIRSTSGGNLYFQTGGAQRWEINSSGNLIGNSGGQILYGDGDVLFPGASANLSWDKSADTLTLQAGAKVGIGTSSPAHPLTLTANPGAANTPVAWLHNSGNVSEYDGTVISTVNDGSDVEVLHVRANTTTYDGGTSLLLVQGDGNVTVSGGVTTLNNTGDNALRVETTNSNPMTVNVIGSAPNYLFDVRDDGTSVFRVDGSGRIGQAGITPGSYHGNADNLVLANDGLSGESGLTIRSGTSDGGNIYFADGTTGDQRYRGYISYSHSLDALQFGSAGAERMRITSSGNLAINRTAAGAKIDIATAADSNGFFIRDESDQSITHNQYIDASGNGKTALYADGQQIKILLNTAGDTYFRGGSVGIGLSDPSSYNAAADDLVVGDGSGNRGMTITCATDGNASLFFADGTSGADAYRGFVQYGQTANSLYLGTNGATRWVVNSSGDLVSQVESQAIDLSGSNYAQLKLADNVNYALQVGQGTDPFVRFNTTNSAEKVEVYKNLYMSGNIEFGSGNGLDFSATSDGSGTMSSELLADYEVGDWSPVYETTGTAYDAIAMGVFNAKYVKVGHKVFISGYIQTTALTHGSASGNLRITGLPFTVSGDSALSVGHGDAFNGNGFPELGHISTDGKIYLKRSGSAGSTNLAFNALQPGSSTYNKLIFSGSYYTTA